MAEPKKFENHIKKSVDHLKEIGNDIKEEITGKNGIFVKTAKASMELLPQNAKKHIITAHKESFEAVKVLVDEYLDAVNKLINKVS